jgi:hypothetical protein
VPSPSESAWDTVRTLPPGTEILIAPNQPRNVRGKIEVVSEDSIRVRSANRQETFLRGEIVWISVRENRRKKHVVSGLQWGAVIGAGLGGVAGLLCTGGGAKVGCFAAFAAAGAAELAGIGALIGAIRPAGEWREIYRP